MIKKCAATAWWLTGTAVGMTPPGLVFKFVFKTSSGNAAQLALGPPSAVSRHEVTVAVALVGCQLWLDNLLTVCRSAGRSGYAAGTGNSNGLELASCRPAGVTGNRSSRAKCCSMTAYSSASSGADRPPPPPPHHGTHHSTPCRAAAHRVPRVAAEGPQ